MRDRTSWRRQLLTLLRPVWPAGPTDLDAGTMLDVELGIHLLRTLLPGEPATAAYTVLAGYPWLDGIGRPTTDPERSRIAVARHLLTPLRTQRDWTTALRRYRTLPEHLRGFVLDDEGYARQREPSVAAQRFAVFETALDTPPPHRTVRMQPAGAGAHLVQAGDTRVSVTIPATLTSADSPPRHDLTARFDRKAVTFTWDELATTAAWLDGREADVLPAQDRRNWTRLFARLRIRCRNERGFVDADSLTVDGVLHLVGMVGAGKSTLMQLMAVCAAGRGQHTTLVLGDVMATLRLTAWLTAVGISAAPVIGASSGLRHIGRLHQVHASHEPSTPALAGFGPEHDLLSTACALDGLRRTTRPWSFRDAPCQDGLTPEGQPDDRSAPPLICPVWSRCQRHRNSRDLATAQVWVATPAGLVHTRVPTPMNAERMRYLELVWRRSDLVIVDEADQVQTQLDAMFSPGHSLFGSEKGAWLELLRRHVDQELGRSSRAQFTHRPVREWTDRLSLADATANRIYALLTRTPLARGRSTLLRWIGRDCFTEWTLATKLMRKWFGDLDDDPRQAKLRAAFDVFLPDPLGERGRAADDPVAASLVRLTRTLTALRDEDARDAVVRDWLMQLDELLSPATSDASIGAAADGRTEEALQVELIVELAVLSNALTAVIRGWRGVEAALHLDDTRSLIFQQPPDDYTPLVPAPPMGTILGYQYREQQDDPAAMGELHFFRCSGVGRWLLLDLHRLLHADSPTGPSILLMSGTSWAGTSPRYDLQIPVHAILQAPDDEVAEIEDTTMFLAPVQYADGSWVTVSGRKGDERRHALREILRSLATCPRPGRPSRFESELAVLPSGRRRVLLIVGSYDEARQVAADLAEIRGDWKNTVAHLVADDSDFTDSWRPTLRRSEISRFAATDATFLVAPLLAVERGHNILNEDDRAAIGSIYFLVRPHPRPDDLTYAVQSMNRWAVDKIRGLEQGHGGHETDLVGLSRATQSAGYRRWRSVLTDPLVYGALEPTAERPALAWTQLVTIWQVIGRLVRGGCAARVHFCDAAFDPAVVGAERSLLTGMYHVLDRYLGSDVTADPASVELAESLYGPCHRALARLLEGR